MKVGVRRPNIKKSIKARTTGKLKRSVKRRINPLYGKRGMGVINNPRKAIYNHVYNRTTVSATELAPGVNRPGDFKYSQKTYKIFGKLGTIISVLFLIIGLIALPVGLIFIIPALLLLLASRASIKKASILEDNSNE